MKMRSKVPPPPRAVPHKRKNKTLPRKAKHKKPPAMGAFFMYAISVCSALYINETRPPYIQIREVVSNTFLTMELDTIYSRRLSSWEQEYEIDRKLQLMDEKEQEELDASDNSEKLPASLTQPGSLYADKFRVGDMVLFSRNVCDADIPTYGMVIEENWSKNEETGESDMGIIVPFSHLSYACRPKEYEMLSELGYGSRVAICDMAFSFEFDKMKCWSVYDINSQADNGDEVYAVDVENIAILWRAWVTGGAYHSKVRAQTIPDEVLDKQPEPLKAMIAEYQDSMFKRFEQLRMAVQDVS